MNVGLAVVLALMLQLPTQGKKDVSWSTIDPFCGQVTSAEPETFPIKSAEVKLYRATAKHLPCCESAAALGAVHVDARGNFDLRKLPPGQYWLVASWDKTEVPVGLWYEGKHHFACDERYKNVIEIKPSAGTAERTVIASNDALTNAKKN